MTQRFCSKAYLSFIREQPCCVQGCNGAVTPSHMKSTKYKDGSDVLAVPACIPKHHVQSTKTSREILEAANVELEFLHRNLWFMFCKQHKIVMNVNIMLREFSEAQRAFEL